jgi:hypothetical protein
MKVEGKEAPNEPGKAASKGPSSPRRKQPKSEAPTRKRRLRCGTTWPEPIKGDVPYANSRDELAGLCLGEKVRIVMGTPAWNEHLRPVLDAMDAERPKMGPAPSYSSEELEACLLFQRLAGVSTYAKARALLAGDRGEQDRAALGFDKHRDRVGRGLHLVTSLEGVPSEATVWRHKSRFGLGRHAAAYRVLFEALVREHFEEFPELADEAQIVHWDGSVLLSHYTSRERKKRRKDGTKEVKPPTLIGGGCMPRTLDNSGKDGHGFCMVAAVTQTGLPLATRLVPLAKEGKGEAETARDMLENEWRRVVAPYLCEDKVRVMAGDGAYSAPSMREAVHRAGFVPNTHTVSHSKRDRSVDNAEDRRAARLEIRGCDNWHLNGLFDLFCKCGKGKTYRRFGKKKSGVFVVDPATGKQREVPEAVARLEGECSTCGRVSLTAGQWRMYNNSKGVSKLLPGEKIDWRVGNPLTFDDPVSKCYGRARYGHGEGFHGTLVTRFGLLREKSWHRDIRQAERDVMQVVCAMHSIAKHQRRLAAGAPGAPLKGASGPPPPLARAA